MATMIRNPGKPWVSIPQAAELLGVSATTMRTIIDKGDVECIKPNKHRRVKVSSLQHYLSTRSAGGQVSGALPPVEDMLSD